VGEIGMKEWVYMCNGKIEGPLSNEEMKNLYKEGTIKESTYVWKQGMYNWEELRQTKLHKYMLESTGRKNYFYLLLDKIKRKYRGE
jgi:hypothetical protein